MPTDTPTTDWVALMPVTLDDAAKQCLQEIERLGSYVCRPYISGDPENDTWAEKADALTDRGLLSVRVIERGETGFAKRYVYTPTETGRLWLKRCAERTGDYPLDDDLMVLFHSLDESVQWQFARWAAEMIGMELQPEDEDED
jgi:hypothetical protein